MHGASACKIRDGNTDCDQWRSSSRQVRHGDDTGASDASTTDDDDQPTVKRVSSSRAQKAEMAAHVRRVTNTRRSRCKEAVSCYEVEVVVKEHPIRA